MALISMLMSRLGLDIVCMGSGPSFWLRQQLRMRRCRQTASLGNPRQRQTLWRPQSCCSGRAACWAPFPPRRPPPPLFSTSTMPAACGQQPTALQRTAGVPALRAQRKLLSAAVCTMLTSHLKVQGAWSSRRDTHSQLSVKGRLLRMTLGS